MSETRIARDALLAEFQGESSVLLDVDARRYHRLNDTAAFIWKGLESSQSDREIASGLARTFEVSEERAEESVQRFLRELTSRGLVREGESSKR
jgi:hypothetical protein